MNLSIIAARCLATGAIGKDGDLPWSLPSDLKNFKRITDGKPVIMGRKTYESIPKKFRPLPNRQNIVLTSNKDWREDGVEVCTSYFDLCLHLNMRSFENSNGHYGQDEVFAIGGERVYREFLPNARYLYMTEVSGYVEGDVHFPIIDEYVWRKSFVCNSYEFDNKKDSHPYQLVVYEKRNFKSTFDTKSLKAKLKIV